MADIFSAFQVMGDLGLWWAVIVFVLVAVVIFVVLHYANKFSKKKLKEELSKEFVRKRNRPAKAL